MAKTKIRSLASLPKTTLPWLTLRDHFIATVGPSAGRGDPLGPLLVLADATFAPRSRFPLHGHDEMEILSIVLSGQLSHHGDQAHGAVMGPHEADGDVAGRVRTARQLFVRRGERSEERSTALPNANRERPA